MTARSDEIKKLRTEQRNPATGDIDTLSSVGIVKLLGEQNRTVADAVNAEAKSIAAAVDVITERLKRGGRLIYIGAGTSGRLGILDASECPPTFSMPPERVLGFIAGGDKAIRCAVENAEDDLNGAKKQLEEAGVCENDAVCGVAASGRTPYVIGGLDYAKSVGAAAICVVNNKNSEMSRHSDVAIEVDTGPEALTGSTRLKAGTAQKLVLNMLSTAAMINLGKTYGNLMVDVKATNEKLRARCVNILRELVGELPDEQLRKTLESASFKVKTACVMIKKGVDAQTANALLDKSGGKLRTALGETK